ncbi:MAG TPA: hypothetical protein ENG03_01420 [Thioploca sp.]|nr:hypothetical protein [Thioploca sp.]
MAKKYNFGFFGLSGSGKTCILAALDMQRIEHPANLTGTLLPIEVKRATGEPEIWTAEEKEADILYKSSDRLEEAKQHLEHSSVPEGTELSIDFIFDYKFSSPQTGDFYARLVDYGGELVNPQNAPQDIAKDLREKMEGMDGLFVLAPAPHPNETKKGVSERLNRLQKTMGLIQFPKPIPIALLVTKWDRLAPLSEYTAAQQPLTKDELPTTEHRDLYNDIVNKVGEDNCKAFPVSAFGQCERHTTPEGKETEFPKQVNPLASFGLLEGFIWVAQRLEAIQFHNHVTQLENYEQAVAGYKKWRPYPSFSLWKLKCQGKKIISLFPTESEMAKRAIQARRQSALVLWSRLIVLPPLIAMVLLMIMSGRQAYDDKKSYDYVHRTLNNPDAQLTDIDKAELWLENYYYTSPIWHPFSWLLVATNEKAKSELDKSRHRNEQRFRKVIQEAPSTEKRLQAAHAYLKALPNGERVGEVKAIGQQAQETLRQRREQQWWQQVEQAPTVTAKLEAARAYLKALPDGEHKAEINSIIVQAQETLRQEKEQRLWQAVEQTKSQTAKLKAARTYQQALPDGKHLAEISKIIAQIEEKLRNEEEQRLWQPVLSATYPRTKIETAQTYLQAKPDGKHAAEAKHIIAQAEQVLRQEKEERWWLPVEQASATTVKVEKARAYLEALPVGKHAVEAEEIIAQYESQQEWTAFTNDYYELFNEGQFLDAALHLSQRQPKDDPKLQVLKRKFRDNVLKSLATQINQSIGNRKWSAAYEKLDHYGNWPDEFQEQKIQSKIWALREQVQKAQDRNFYRALIEFKDIERAETYLSTAPKQTMRAQVEEYKKYLLEKKNPLRLTLILAKIEWGDLSADDNIIIVTMNGKKIIEKEGISAVTNDSTGEIGRKKFTRKLSDSVKIEVKIEGKDWWNDLNNNGQGQFEGRVADLNGKNIKLIPPEHKFTNQAVFRLEGIPPEPHLPDWAE